MHRLSKTVMKSHRFRIPKYDMPIRLRPWFLAFTCIVMVLLALLGLTSISRSLPLNGELLRFLCFCLATGVFYFIVDVEEEARRIWFWRHSGLIFTGITCFFCGGVLSEVVHSLLPYKEFEFRNVVANLLGSSVGLFAAYHMERHYRYRREIARLYRPINTDSLSDDDDDEVSTQLLPIYDGRAGMAPKATSKPTRLTDVWDEREEVFGIVGESDDEEQTLYLPRHHNGVPVPTISVTTS